MRGHRIRRGSAALIVAVAMALTGCVELQETIGTGAEADQLGEILEQFATSFETGADLPADTQLFIEEVLITVGMAFQGP